MLVFVRSSLHPRLVGKYWQSFGAVATHDHHDHDHDHHHHEPKRSRPPVEYNTITQFLDHDNLKTYFQVGPGYMKYPGVDYGGHHHHEAYDWRKDPKVNKDLEENVMERGQTHLQQYSYPFEGRDGWVSPYAQKNNDFLYSPTLVLKPENKKTGAVEHPRKSIFFRLQDDVNHEYDYESEDHDYQCESFRMQHFRKKGWLSPWMLVPILPFFYFWAEFLYQHYPDEDHWRLSVPPPLNYPDTEDTDDTDTYDDYHSPEGRYLRDIGIIGPLWYDIVDGKKVYTRFSCVNQPMEDI